MSKPNEINSIVGQIAKDRDFFDRDEVLAQLAHDARTDHLLLLAPRRVGKTSLLYKLADTLESNDTHAVYVSVQSAVDELDFLRLLHAACAKHSAAAGILVAQATRGIKQLLGRVQEVRIADFGLTLDATEREHWQTRAGELVTALGALPGRWFYLIDELPVFVLKLVRDDPSGGRARSFLEWFRSIRQAPHGAQLLRHWILAGSIGLDTVAHRHRLSNTVNDLRHVRLGAFDEKTAMQFLAALGRGAGVKLSIAVRRRILERAGWPIPYHLQVVFAAIKDRGETPTVALVDQVFEDLLRQHSYFDSWHERLTDQLGDLDAERARLLLRAVARDAGGMRRDLLESVLATSITDASERERNLRYLLDVLINDGYLHPVEDRYAFRSELLRAFWVRRYG